MIQHKVKKQLFIDTRIETLYVSHTHVWATKAILESKQEKNVKWPIKIEEYWRTKIPEVLPNKAKVIYYCGTHALVFQMQHEQVIWYFKTPGFALVQWYKNSMQRYILRKTNIAISIIRVTAFFSNLCVLYTFAWFFYTTFLNTKNML